LKLDGNNHRGEEFNNLILPRCLPLIEAIGHRMAYDAAIKFKLDPDVISMYEVGVMKLDLSWYVEHAGVGRLEQAKMENNAASALLPKLGKLVDETDAAPYAMAPIMSQESFALFANALPLFRGNAPQMPLINPHESEPLKAQL
jgi:acyl-CoA oxidase